MHTEHPILVRRRREDSELQDRWLHKARRNDTIKRVVAGSYVLSQEWNQLNPMQQHQTRVLEVVDRARGTLVITHDSAAAIHGIDRIGAWPTQVSVRIARASGGRSSGAVRRLALGFEDVELLEWRGHLITSPAQTAIDIASSATYTGGVIAFDQALWRRRPEGALTDMAHVEELLASNDRRGLSRVPKALAFATGLSDSVRESEGRVLIARLGFPAPVLQQRFILPGGRTAYSDYYWREYDHVGEFDGTGKYFDPDILRGRTPEQALLEEKDRADALRRQVAGMSRWRVPAHRNPVELYDILTADGLPSRFPRPRRAS